MERDISNYLTNHKIEKNTYIFYRLYIDLNLFVLYSVSKIKNEVIVGTFFDDFTYFIKIHFFLYSIKYRILD